MLAYHVEIDVDSAEVVQEKVAQSICALDGVPVVLPRGQEPGVLVGYELCRCHVGPELRKKCEYYNPLETCACIDMGLTLYSKSGCRFRQLCRLYVHRSGIFSSR